MFNKIILRNMKYENTFLFNTNIKENLLPMKLVI
jgi:hypothetical protein